MLRISTLLVSTLVLLLSQAGNAGAQNAATTPTVLTKSVETVSFRPSFEHPGRVESLQTATVRPIIPAQIDAIHVRAGDVVSKRRPAD